MPPDTVNEHVSADHDTKRQSPNSLHHAAVGTSESHASWTDWCRELMSGPSWADLPDDGMLGHCQLQSGIMAAATISHQWDDWPAGAPEPASTPFDRKQAAACQIAWSKYCEVPVESINSVGMTMVLIPPGKFLMGTTAEQIQSLIREARDPMESLFPCEQPLHPVTITQPYLLGNCEVTRGQFRLFVDATGYKTDAEKDGKGGLGYPNGVRQQDAAFHWDSNAAFPQSDGEPVVNVSWNDAEAFCQWLSEKENIAYLLPTEAQWEHACRAGTTGLWYCGESEAELRSHAWFATNSERKLHSGALLKPNPWNLYDMYGNVWEWCDDIFDSTYYGRSPEVDPARP